ncbi:MAG: hypothetical protein ACI9MR_001386 [Myxococcota bacterium]|jgi:hypothetical protein
MLRLALTLTAAALALSGCDKQTQQLVPTPEAPGQATPPPAVNAVPPINTAPPVAPVKAAPARTPAPPTVEAPPRPEGEKSTQDYDSLVRGKTLADLEKRYGKPARTYAFKMGDGIPEFRIELLNTYAPGTNKDVEILEHTYQLEGYRFTIWYHEKAKGWLALEAVSYVDGVQF